MKTTHLKIRQLRKSRRITQEDMANKLGISRTHLSSMENGTETLSIKSALIYAELFNVSLDYLYDLSYIPYRIDETKTLIDATGLTDVQLEIINKNIDFFLELNLKDKDKH